MKATNPTLKNRVALVTGGGRGIGQAISVGLAERGARVAVLARSADQVRGTAGRITRSGGEALALPADVGDPDQVAAALGALGQRWGPVKLLVNNAAVVWPLGPSATIDASQWATAIAINVTAAARLGFTVLPGMLAQGWGRIVNVSSGIAASPTAMLRANAYATSKAALEAHTLNLAAELAGTGITVNVFRPGGVDTAMQAWIRKQDPEQIGATLHQRFVDNYQQGTLLTPGQSAASLLTRLPSPASGQIWDANDPQ
jgi:NAD(P)-dependent dehydrogenase (short-subunit alcohol dehydrogenase family)